MTSLDAVKNELSRLFRTDPRVHVNVSLSHPKVCVQNEAVVIKGIYPHIFQIEEYSSGAPKCHTVQYSDLLTKNVEILELGSF